MTKSPWWANGTFISKYIQEWKPAQKMEWGSASLANEYRKDTPGQTLKTIKRVVKSK